MHRWKTFPVDMVLQIAKRKENSKLFLKTHTLMKGRDFHKQIYMKSFEVLLTEIVETCEKQRTGALES